MDLINPDFTIGLYVLVGLACLTISIYQNIVLIKNYFKYDTVQKIDEMTVEGLMNTPEIILCRDPPNFNKSSKMFQSIALHNFELETAVENFNPSVQKFNTFYKVIFCRAQGPCPSPLSNGSLHQARAWS